MFTFETTRLDGGSEFTRKEKLFKRLSLGDLPGSGGREPGRRGRAPPAWRGQSGDYHRITAEGVGVGRMRWDGEGGGCHLSEPQFTSLYKRRLDFKGPSIGNILRVPSGVILCP